MRLADSHASITCAIQDYGNEYYLDLYFAAGPSLFVSPPLNRPRRLAGHVINDTVDALHLVDDAGGDAADEFHVEGIEVSCHAVGRGHRAQPNDIIIGAVVAHDADGAHRQQHGEGLPDVVVEAGAADFLDIDGVGTAQDFELFLGDAARAADGEARAGKRMAADEDIRQAELAAKRAYFVL